MQTIFAADLEKVKVISTDRHLPRKQQAALARQLFKALGIKGVSVTTPNYSMAQAVDVRIKADAPQAETFGCTLRELPADHPVRVFYETKNAARLKLQEILARAFPCHDDRSELQTDYFDYCWSVD